MHEGALYLIQYALLSSHDNGNTILSISTMKMLTNMRFYMTAHVALYQIFSTMLNYMDYIYEVYMKSTEKDIYQSTYKILRRIAKCLTV
jgi:hypothetical protein